MNTNIARLAYMNAHKKLAAKNKSQKEPLKTSLLTKPDYDKINSSKDDDVSVLLLEKVLKGFNNV